MHYKVKMEKRAIKAFLIFGIAWALNVPAAFAEEDWIRLPTSASDVTFTIDKASIERKAQGVKKRKGSHIVSCISFAPIVGGYRIYDVPPLRNFR